MHFTTVVARSDENLAGQVVAGGNRAVSVHAEVDNAPVLHADQTSLPLGTAASGTLLLKNTGWGVASYAVGNKPSWLTITPDAADIVTPFGSAPQSQELVFSIDRTGLSVGPYSGSVHIGSAAGNLDIAVSMTVGVAP
jgi:hypothetical protein